MNLLDRIFGTGTDRDGRVRNQTLLPRGSATDDKEVISVDPTEMPPDPPRRPPIIFENGLQ